MLRFQPRHLILPALIFIYAPQLSAQWIPVRPYPDLPRYDVFSMEFPSDNVGFYYDRGELKRTTDAGATWESARSIREVNGFCAFSAANLAMLHMVYRGEYGHLPETAVSTSVDSGRTWTTSQLKYRARPYFLNCSSTGLAFATGYILEDTLNWFAWSTNAGMSWNTSESTYDLRSLSFRDRLHGVAIGEIQYYTSDGGITWAPGDLPRPRSGTKMLPLARLNGWIMGADHGVITSADGAHWQYDSLFADTVVALDFSSDGTIGYAVTYRTESSGASRYVIYRSSNGGQDWSYDGGGTEPYEIHDIYVANEQVAYLRVWKLKTGPALLLKRGSSPSRYGPPSDITAGSVQVFSGHDGRLVVALSSRKAMSIELFSPDGRLIEKVDTDGRETYEFDLSDQPSGIYWVRADGATRAVRFVR